MLAEIEPRELDARHHRREPIGGGQARVASEVQERGVPRRAQPHPRLRLRERDQAHDIASVVGEKIEVLARKLRVGQRGRREVHRSGITARFRILGRGSGSERLQLEACRRPGLIGRAGKRKAGERGRDILLRHQLLIVGDPGVVSKHAPILGRELRLLVALAGGERGGQRILHRARAVHRHRQDAHVLVSINFAGESRDLAAVRLEQDHRRIAAHLEARALALRARLVTVDVYRHEKARALDKILAIEDRGLDLIARRAPRGAPVEEHGLALLLGGREGGIDVALVPRDAVIGMGRGGLHWRRWRSGHFLGGAGLRWRRLLCGCSGRRGGL